MSSKDAAQQAVFVVAACAGGYPSEWCRLGGFTRVLFPVIHLLLELLRLLFVDKGQARDTVLYLESVEESSVLVVAPRVEYLLVPYDPSHGGLR